MHAVERHEQDGFDLTPTTWDTTGAPFERTDFMGRARYQFNASASLSVLANGYDNTTRGRSNGELGPQEDEIKDSTLNVNTTFDWLPRPSTAVQTRVYIARYDESSTAMLAPPVSTPLEPGMLDERVTKIANYGLEDGEVFDFITRTTPTGGKEQTFIGQILAGASKGGPPSGLFGGGE